MCGAVCIAPAAAGTPANTVVPAWFVKTTDIAEIANVEIRAYKVEIQTTVGKSSGALTVQIPALTNVVDLAKGAELFLRRALVGKDTLGARVKLGPVAIESARKRQKT